MIFRASASTPPIVAEIQVLHLGLQRLQAQTHILYNVVRAKDAAALRQGSSNGQNGERE